MEQPGQSSPRRAPRPRPAANIGALHQMTAEQQIIRGSTSLVMKGGRIWGQRARQTADSCGKTVVRQWRDSGQIEDAIRMESIRRVERWKRAYRQQTGRQTMSRQRTNKRQAEGRQSAESGHSWVDSGLTEQKEERGSQTAGQEADSGRERADSASTHCSDAQIPCSALRIRPLWSLRCRRRPNLIGSPLTTF